MQGSPDLTVVKERQQAAWSAGDYTVIGTKIVIVGEMLCEAADLRAGQRVLDVATGSGNTALSAARRECEVIGVDYVPALLQRARERAAAERLPVEFQEGDAENLAFPAASFDGVLSTFGVMFTPDQERAAGELARVCRSGGKIALANWTPGGFIGQVFKIIGSYVPAAPGTRSPARWGTEEGLRELLGDCLSALETTPRHYCFRFRSPEHWLDTFRTYYGPLERAFAALDEEGQVGLARDLTALLTRLDQGGGSGLVVPSEYLEVVAIRR
jgi:SAM-dependent methyltransferase